MLEAELSGTPFPPGATTGPAESAGVESTGEVVEFVTTSGGLPTAVGAETAGPEPVAAESAGVGTAGEAVEFSTTADGS